MTPESRRYDRIFYDGDCGLCHRTVLFALARDRSGELFRFSPLQGETFSAAVPEAARASLPDSIVLETADGGLLLRSDAVVRLLQRAGGGWRLAGSVLRLVPRSLRDLGYDLVARVRKRLFARPAAACPVVPAALRERFLP